MIKSLYAILNVSPDADPAVIEAAYKALIKKYHPDAHGGVVVDEHRAAEINHAFYVLKHPERRAEYDAKTKAAFDALRAPPVYAVRPHELGFAGFPPPVRAARSKWPTLMLIAALSALVYYAWHESDGLGRLASARHAASAAFNDLERERPLPPLKAATVHAAVAEFRTIRDSSGLMGLVAFSQDCFDRQSRSSSVEDFDFCIAFDDAAITYDGGSLGSYGLPKLAQFEASRVAFRHAAAGRLLSNDDAKIAARLDQIRTATAESLVRQLDAELPERPAAQHEIGSELSKTEAVASPLPPPVKSSFAERNSRANLKPNSPSRAKSPPPKVRRSREEPRNKKRAPDADFVERQGYIY